MDYDKNAVDTGMVKKYISWLLYHALELDLEYKYDSENQIFYIKTEFAFWKIRDSKSMTGCVLEHAPFRSYTSNVDSLSIDMAMTAKYHIQGDANSPKPLKLLYYAVKHDKALLISGGDIKKLPRETKLQKKYYRQAKNREQRKSVIRVIKIIEQMENDRMYG